MSAPTGFTTVTAGRLQDASGSVINNATIYFQPVDNNGTPLSFLAGGLGGQVSSQPVQAQVSGGAFSVTLADTSLTNPVNVCYSVTCLSNMTGASLLGGGYTQFQPSGTTVNFDLFVPNLLAQAIIQLGPTGPVGATGAQGPQGPAYVPVLNSVAYSATPAFLGTSAVAFQMVLTGNVTSSTFTSGNPGAHYTFIIKQDATGGRTFTWPSNAYGAPVISSGANTITTVTFVCDASGNLYTGVYN